MYTSARQCCAFVMFSDDVPRLLNPRSDLAMRIPYYISCWETRCTCQTDVKRVEIGAFPAQILGFQHKTDIAYTAAADFRISKCVLDDPLVDRMRLLQVSIRTASDFICCDFHDPSVGSIFVGRLKYSSSARSALGALPGMERSIT